MPAVAGVVHRGCTAPLLHAADLQPGPRLEQLAAAHSTLPVAAFCSPGAARAARGALPGHEGTASGSAKLAALLPRAAAYKGAPGRLPGLDRAPPCAPHSRFELRGWASRARRPPTRVTISPRRPAAPPGRASRAWGRHVAPGAPPTDPRARICNVIRGKVHFRCLFRRLFRCPSSGPTSGGPLGAPKPRASQGAK